MRALEIALWLVSAIGAAWSLLRSPSGRIHATLAAVAISVALAHAAVEGTRILMIPTYALATAMIAVAATRMHWTVDHRANRRFFQLAARVALAVWVAIAAVVPSAFPVFSYERPTGKYAIGTAVYESSVLTHTKSHQHSFDQRFDATPMCARMVP